MVEGLSLVDRPWLSVPMTEQMNQEICTYFIVSHDWKLEIRHKSKLKKIQHSPDYRGKLSFKLTEINQVKFENIYYLYNVYENNGHSEGINIVESF